MQDAMDAGPFGLGDVDQARLFEPGTTDLSAATPVDSYGWNTHSLTTYGRDWDDVETGQWGADVGIWKETCGGTFNTVNNLACDAPEDTLTGNVVINEVESNPGVSPAKAGDWVELYNKGVVNAHIAGAVISDSGDDHAFQIPGGTADLAPGAYVAFQVDDSSVDGNFGLGAADSARLFRAGSDMADPLLPGLVDSYTWSSHAAQTYGRCANGVGSFVNTIAPTPGAANNCPTP